MIVEILEVIAVDDSDYPFIPDSDTVAVQLRRRYDDDEKFGTAAPKEFLK